MVASCEHLVPYPAVGDRNSSLVKCMRSTLGCGSTRKVCSYRVRDSCQFARLSYEGHEGGSSYTLLQK